MGFATPKVTKVTEAQARQKLMEKQSERDQHIQRLVEKYSKSKGLAFGNGKLEEAMAKDPRKTSNLLLILENTEKKANSNRMLLENVRTAQLMNDAKIQEAIQTGNASALLMPSDIVKISRIAYTNSVADEIFDVWGLESMKDSLWKLETIVASDARGGKAGKPIIEQYGDANYSTTTETVDVKTYTKDTAIVLAGPALKYRFAVIADGVQIGNDDGAGNLIVEGSKVATINYGTPNKGAPASITFTEEDVFASATNAVVEYVADFEDKDYMKNAGSTLLNLIEYPFSAVFKPMRLEWTQFTQDVMESKMGFSAKDTLIAGASEQYKKNFDLQLINLGKRAANSWDSSVEFSADWKTAGAVSAHDYAQNIVQKVAASERKTYKAISRLADKTNMVIDANTWTYLTKCDRFTEVEPASKVGIFKVGTLGGRNVYVAPDEVFDGEIDETKGVAYLFGKNDNGMNVDSPVSCGVYGTGLTTPELQYADFTTECGLGSYMDYRILNNKLATKLVITDINKG